MCVSTGLPYAVTYGAQHHGRTALSPVSSQWPSCYTNCWCAATAASILIDSLFALLRVCREATDAVYLCMW
jgi:hypothetical protein